jgi:hypothetical protein
MLLRGIKQNDNVITTPVVVFTKPIDFAQLKRDMRMLVKYWFEVTTLPDRLEDSL